MLNVNTHILPPWDKPENPNTEFLKMTNLLIPKMTNLRTDSTNKIYGNKSKFGNFCTNKHTYMAILRQQRKLPSTMDQIVSVTNIEATDLSSLALDHDLKSAEGEA